MTDAAPISRADAEPVAGPVPLVADGATPMMEQYIEIKTANPDSLLFYRMGDFYELFFDDAEQASRALGITLTRRGKHRGEDIPMCGVPVHAADDYLHRLIQIGFRVAVCEQIEDPAEAKKRGSKSVVRRDVVRLVTPGTITEDKILAAGEASHLVAIGRVRSGEGFDYALACVDISTGLFRVMPSGEERLASDVMRLDPRELVVPDAMLGEPAFRLLFDTLRRAISPQPQQHFDSSTAAARITRFYDVAVLDGFGLFGRAELSAISGVIAYLEKTQKAERPPLQRPEREDTGTTLFIDPATRASLEILRTATGGRDGSLFAAVDRTVTGAGARLLAARLTSPSTDISEIAARLDAVSFFRAEDRLRAALRAALRSAPDMVRALSRLALNRGGPRDLGAICAGLVAASELAALVGGADLPPRLRAALEHLGAAPAALTAHLQAALADELPLIRRDGHFVRAGYAAELDELRALATESRRVIAQMERALCDETGVRSLKIRHNNVLGYYIEVTANNSDALTSGDAARARFIHRQTMASAMRFTTTELAEMETKIANAADKALALELATFDRLLAETVAAADAIRTVAAALAEFDVSAALAELAAVEDYVRPDVEDGLDFRVEGGRHPVVEQALRRQLADAFVANDCDLSPPDGAQVGAIWLLTGPNMGGKSTFLRQNALIAVLAQAGSFVPARSARIGVVDRLFSRVGASDDLARGRSTFMVEMVETAAILNQATPRSLVILDEIGRGTATFDGLSIAWAAVEYLHEQNRCRAIFATHFHEMTALAGKLPRLANVTMRVKEWEGEVVFLHEVARGAADRSYGVQVARLAGLPLAVVDRARAVLQQLEAGETSGKAARLVDDLPLFSAAARREPERKPAVADDRLTKALGELQPDEMSPREALEAIYRLRSLLPAR